MKIRNFRQHAVTITDARVSILKPITHTRISVPRLVIIFLLLFSKAAVAVAQGTTPVLPRIGDAIDSVEIAYFGLFPDADDPRAASVLRSDAGMMISVRSDRGTESFALSTCEAEVFARCLDMSERIGGRETAMDLLARELSDPSLQRCFASFMQKRILTLTVLHEAKGRPQQLVLRDGTLLEGIPIFVTDSIMAFWTWNGGYDHRLLDSSLVITSLSAIDSVHGTFYKNSTALGWLGWWLSTAALMYWISEGQRNVYDGPGGTGTTVIPFPFAFILSGIVSILPGMVTASASGDLLTSLPVTKETSAEVVETFRENVMYEETPPEVLRAIARTAIPEASFPETFISDETEYDPSSPPQERESSPVTSIPDVEIGVAFLMNLYDVRARPFGVLPALSVGKEILLLRDGWNRPLFSLFPHAGYGPLHSSAGINMLLHLGPRGQISMGFDYVRNRDVLGRFLLEHTTGGGRTETARFVEGDWKSSAFVTVGFGFHLAGCRVLLEARWGLAPAIIVHHHDNDYYDPWNQPKDYESAPKSYSGLGLSIAYPIRF